MAEVTTYGAPLSLVSAHAILAAAREASKAYGDSAIAVVGPGGHLIAFERADGCQTGSGKIAIAKARSSVAFKKDTSLFQAQVGDDFARDYRGLHADGSEWGALDVWVKRDGVVRHFWGEEIGADMADPGQDPRGAVEIAPLWTVLDLTPGGRGKDWYPRLEYPG